MGVMANMLQISIFPPNSQWNLNLRAVVDGLTINWGRTNLYRAPANRTCQFQMLMEHVTLTRVMQKWVNSELIITAKPASGDLVIFQGIIDDFKVTPKDTKIGDYIVDFTATESPTWSNRLNGLFYDAKNLRDFNTRLGRVQRELGTFIALDINTSYLAEPPENQISVKQLAESLVWRPGAFPAWCPDWKRLAPTVHQLDTPEGGAPWVLSPKVLIDLDQGMSWTSDNTPTTILYSAGGLFGKSKYARDTRVLRETRDQWDRGNIVELDIPYCPDQGGIIGYAENHAELAKAQLGSPRRIRLDTRRNPDFLNTYLGWECWETPNRYIQVTGDKWATKYHGELLLQQTYYPIGGTLTLYHWGFTHDLYCAWGPTDDALTPPPPPPPPPPRPTTWATTTTTWATTTGTWKG